MTAAAAPEGEAEARRVMAEVAGLLEDLHAGGRRHLRWETDLSEAFALDSLALVELQDRLEAAFGIRLPDTTLGSARTPADWLAAVLEAQGEAHPPRVPAPHEAEPGARGRGSAWPQDAVTLPEALLWHVEHHPELVAVRLLGEDGGTARDLTYGALQSGATRCAWNLLLGGLAPGGRVAIMLPTGHDYFVVSMGVMLAGGVPVPVYPPVHLSALEEHLRRQATLLRNAGAQTLVTVPEALLAARLLRAQVPDLRSVLTPASLQAGSGRHGALPGSRPEDVALVQYTSGSTGDPKGVVLTHSQLLANARAMGAAARVDNTDVFVSWLPLYHDMGLIGAWHTASLCFGMLLVVMSPLRFLARPASWLEAISRYKGTLSAAPNFAYEQCVERVSAAEIETLDLSSWRLAFNGSEPVQAGTIERFTRRFAPCGFRSEAMCPAYGLAEVGVGVSFSPLGRPPRVDRINGADLACSARAVPAAPTAGAEGVETVVSCGVALPGYEVRVADDEGRDLPERHEGRVQCRGPSATRGYFDNPAATGALWRRGWLDTGDTGYVAEGELFLTGRSRDMVIRAGRNLHPEDVEEALASVPGLVPGGVAAFGVRDPGRATERLVVAAETGSADPDERDALRGRIAARSLGVLGVRPDEIALVPPRSVLRTPSGKIRRGDTRDAYLSGRLGHRAAPVPLQLLRLALGAVAPLLRGLRRAPLTVLYAAWVWLLVVVVGVPVWLAMLLPSTPRTRWRLVRAAGRAIAAAGGIDVRVTGSQAPGPVPAVVVANHPSFVDGLALVLAMPEPVSFVSSTDFERQRIAGPFLRRLGCVFVHREDPGRSAGEVAQLVELARAGRRLVFFPEGSIAGRRGVRPFHLGAFAVAGDAGCPVVPVGIRGTRDVLRPGSFVPRRAPVDVVLGTPRNPPGGHAFDTELRLADECRRAVAQLSGEPMLD